MSSIALTQTYQTTSLTGKPFIRRLAALLIDRSIIFIADVLVLVFVLVHFLIVVALMGRDIDFFEEVSLINLLVSAIKFFSYLIIFEWLYSATPGKLMLGMHVVKMNGSQCDIKAVVVRALFLNANSILFGLIAYLSMRSPLYQRIGDRVAGTIVVDRNEAPSLLPPSGGFWRRQRFI